MVSHGCFNLHLPDDTGCGISYYRLICHLYIFSGEVSVKVFGAFFNQVVYFIVEL